MERVSGNGEKSPRMRTVLMSTMDPLSERRRMPALTFDATPPQCRPWTLENSRKHQAREVLILDTTTLVAKVGLTSRYGSALAHRQLLDNRDAYLEVRNL